MKPDLALLVDGDQVAPDGLPGLLERLEVDWVVSQRTVVRNWRSSKDLQQWREFSAEHGFRCIQRDPVATGKNAADIELAVEAMDLMHGLGYRAFCFVTGDTDFTPVVQRLRRGGCTVEWVSPKDIQARRPARRSAGHDTGRGAGGAARTEAPAPPTVKASRPARPSREPAHKAPATPAAVTEKQRAFARHVRRAIGTLRDRNEHERGWVSVNRVGSILAEEGHKREDFGFAKSRQLRAVLEELGFRLEQVETGQYRVTMD